MRSDYNITLPNLRCQKEEFRIQTVQTVQTIAMLLYVMKDKTPINTFEATKNIKTFFSQKRTNINLT